MIRKCVKRALARYGGVLRGPERVTLAIFAVVRDFRFQKEDIRIYFNDGYLIFSKPIAGERRAAVFTADVEGGDGEVLLLPPNRGNGNRSRSSRNRRISTNISARRGDFNRRVHPRSYRVHSNTG